MWFKTGVRYDGKRITVAWETPLRDSDSGTAANLGRSPITYPSLCQHWMTPYLGHNAKLSGWQWLRLPSDRPVAGLAQLV